MNTRAKFYSGDAIPIKCKINDDKIEEIFRSLVRGRKTLEETLRSLAYLVRSYTHVSYIYV